MSSVLGIDMGTRNLKIFNKSDSNILNIKNTISIINKNQMYAYGDEAYSMYEKAPEMIQVSFPVEYGVIADFDNMQTILSDIFENTYKNIKLKSADVYVTVPTAITEVEKKAFSDIFIKMKNRPKNVYLVEKPLADAMGIGLDIIEPTGVMVVNLGADTTEISVISLGGLVQTELLPFGGNHVDDAIVSHIRKKYNLVIGKKTACLLKEEIGSAMPGATESLVIVGRDVPSGLPVEMKIPAKEVYEGMKSCLTDLCNNIKYNLEQIPPELARDVVHAGIYLTGGSSKIKNLDELFTEVTNIRVNLCENPEETAAKGLSVVASNSKFNKFGYSMTPRIFK